MTQGRLLPALSSQLPVSKPPVFIEAACEQQTGLWVEVLVDCPGVQGVFTYGLAVGLMVQPGDILSVPFGAQQMGGVVVQCLDHLPSGVNLAQLREIDGVIARGFFPPAYWEILLRVAEYYCTPLMQVIRMALPTGLLGRSQRRIKLSQKQGVGIRDQGSGVRNKSHPQNRCPVRSRLLLSKC